MTSSRIGNAADACPPPRPGGLPPLDGLISCVKKCAESPARQAAAKCEITFARAPRCRLRKSLDQESCERNVRAPRSFPCRCVLSVDSKDGLCRPSHATRPKTCAAGAGNPLPFRLETQSGRLHCPKARSLNAHSCFGRSLLLCQDHKKGHLHGSDQCCCRFFRLRSDFQACQRIGIGAGAPLSAGRTC